MAQFVRSWLSNLILDKLSIILEVRTLEAAVKSSMFGQLISFCGGRDSGLNGCIFRECSFIKDCLLINRLQGGFFDSQGNYLLIIYQFEGNHVDAYYKLSYYRFNFKILNLKLLI